MGGEEGHLYPLEKCICMCRMSEESGIKFEAILPVRKEVQLNVRHLVTGSIAFSLTFQDTLHHNHP